MEGVGIQPDDAEHLTTGFIDGDKSHRAREVKVRQLGDKLMREFLDGVEEAKPQIFFAYVRQEVAKQAFVIGSDPTNKYPPALAKNEMPLPLGIVQANN
jgi:hypothetical protein